MGNPSQPTLQPRQSTLRATVQTALISGTLLLLLVWLGAWVLDLARPVVLVATSLVVIAGAAAVALRLALDGAAPRSMPLSQHAGVQTIGKADPAAGRQARRDPAPKHLRGKRWSLDVFANIDAQRFAAVCETWFSWAGFDTRHESHRTQEGVDIWLNAARLPGPVAIVRCKYALNKPVGLQELRDFQGLVSNCQPAHGTFTTTSTYTPEALQFAKENDIELVDGRGLLCKILTRTQQRQQALLAVAYHGS